MTWITLIVLADPALAQSGATYKLEEHTFNAAGHPDGGSLMTGAGYRITLDAVGDGVAAKGLAGSSYSMGAGFGTAYGPPGQVSGLLFTTKTDF